MDFQGVGKQFEGLYRLAMIGAAFMVGAWIAGLIGLGYLAFWAWNHVSVAVH